jgi:hypothetical protein
VTFPDPYGRPPLPQRQPEQPGVFPLRPLGAGEILTTAVRIAWRNMALLWPVAFLVAALAFGVEVLVLAANGHLQDYIDGTWASSLPSNPTRADLDRLSGTVWGLAAASGAGAVISFCLAPLAAGIAAPAVAEAAVRRTGTIRSVLDNLRGRWAALVGASLLGGLAIAGGFVLLIVPGILLWLGLSVIGPVAVMEKLPPVEAFRRSWRLTTGYKPRVFGVFMLAALFQLLIGFGLGLILGSVFGQGSTASWIGTEIVTVLVGGFISAWFSTVVAVLYVDIRMRKEGLAQALAASVNPAGPQY